MKRIFKLGMLAVTLSLCFSGCRVKEDKKEKKFTPIQVTKKSQTYKLEADERFKEMYKFIKSEFDSGKSMFEILEKVAKLKVDKTA